MLEVFLDLDNSCSLMLLKDNNIILFETIQYDTKCLDTIYFILHNYKLDKATIICHGIRSNASLANSYVIHDFVIDSQINRSYVAVKDIDKLHYLFQKLNVTDIKIFDAMEFYSAVLPQNSCGVITNIDGSCSIYFKDTAKSELVQTKADLLEQTLLSICHRTNCTNIINLSDYVDYDCICNFSNFTSLTEIMLYAKLSIFGYFKFRNVVPKFDITQTNWNSKFENPTSASVSTASTTLTMDEHKEQQDSKQVKVKKPVEKQKKSHTKALLSFIIVLSILLTVAACIASIILENKAYNAYNEMVIAEDNVNHSEKYLEKLTESTPMEYVCDVRLLQELCPFDSQIGNITVDTEYEILYYIAETNTLDDVTDAYNNLFLVNGVSDGGIVVLNDITYNKYTVSVSKQ